MYQQLREANFARERVVSAELPRLSRKWKGVFLRIVDNTYVGAAIALAHSDKATSARLKIMMLSSIRS